MVRAEADGVYLFTVDVEYMANKWQRTFNTLLRSCALRIYYKMRLVGRRYYCYIVRLKSNYILRMQRNEAI